MWCRCTPVVNRFSDYNHAADNLEENCERSRSDNELLQRDYGKGLSELI